MPPPPACLLFGVSATGAVPVPAPVWAGDANEVFDAERLGIYEGMRSFEHLRLFALEQHLDRAQRSMDLLGWGEVLERRLLRRALHEALEQAPWPDSRIRFDVLAEPARELGLDCRMWIALSELRPVPADFLRLGTCSRLVRDLRRNRPLIKEASFVIDRRIHPGGQREDYEPIMVNERGQLLEGTSSNIFGLCHGVLRTAGEGVLLGITRAVFLDLARSEGIPIREEALTLPELPQLSEAFLTSSVRGLVPIVRLGDLQVGAGHPGPMGGRLAVLYGEHVSRAAAPAWPPPVR